ncbi:MAG: glycosyl hydrolase [Saprospiraceae bacterium]
MKSPIARISAILIALVLGILFFTLLTFAGDKGRGPLQDLAGSLQTAIARMEQKVMGGPKTRAASLRWFEKYRKDLGALRHPENILLGAYDNHTLNSYEPIVALEDSLDTVFPIISLYTAWGSKPEQTFPALRIQTIHTLGSMPLLTWEPWLNDFDPVVFPFNSGAENRNKGGLKAIAEGQFDAYIDKWAQEAAKLNVPFFLRLGHEMNDPYRYPWGPQNNAPEDFIAAWKHVVERFRANGAYNVLWVWSPHPAYPPFDVYYPGDDYIDWIGISVLNYGTVAVWSQWWSFDQVVEKFYAAVAPHEKPLMLTEFGSLAVGGDRAEWLSEALTSLPTDYPLIKSVVFFHTSDDATTTYKSLDWSFRTDTTVTEALKASFESWK